MAELPVPEDGGSGNGVLEGWKSQPVLNPVVRLLYSSKFVFGTLLMIIVAFAGATPEQLIELGMYVYGFVAGGNILEAVAKNFGNGRG